jgi:phosphatidylserine synthase
MKLLLARKFIYKNLPNIVSVLGVLPLSILFLENGFQYLVLLIIYNNIMDDLDGILAWKLNLKSQFGGVLDNVCDAVAHIIFVMTLGIHYGIICSLAGLVAGASILIRVTSRITVPEKISTGSPTNELMRHMLLILLTAKYFEFSPVPLLITVLILNAVSMLAPYPMRYMIRALTTSAGAIGLVNISLMVAWWIPFTAPVIAFCFFASYLYSFIAGGMERARN